ncbi:unnamed protein product [Larinioides sclopetarius]|uniref:Thyroglobulin type-1 domain-containing protein n=1 Tax=Larinioides sclopetarius TaxID=280406 RepID=A0AAV2AQN1_9ARAC
MSRKFLFVALALAVIIHVVTADCQKDRTKAKHQQKNGGKDVYVPRCKKNGDYKRAQCNFSKFVCFCVDPKTGKQVSKEKKGAIHCSSS